MRVYKIDWTESERGWGQRPDGYSFHKTPEAAAAYLKKEYDSLPAATPDEYSFPGGGWVSSVTASVVDIEDNGLLAKELAKADSTRVFKIFSDPAYNEARSLTATDIKQNIDFLKYKPTVATTVKAVKPASPKRYKL